MCCKFPPECGVAAFHDRDLALELPVDSFHAVLQARIECMETELRLNMEEQKKSGVEEVLARLRRLGQHKSEVLRHRKHIENEILQDAHPHVSRCG